MKSKKLWIGLVFVAIAAGAYFLYLSKNPLAKALSIEWVENTFPEKVDEEGAQYTVLPYGYTLGAWPNYFHGEPIVTRLTYQKGPPKKFIQQMTQIWRPVEVELMLDGPKTIDATLSAQDWKNCFTQNNACLSAKKILLNYAVKDLLARPSINISFIWFDSLDPLGARGLHTHFESETYFVDRYTLFTEKGVAQSFSLKYVKNPLGLEAKDLFLKVMGGLKVKDDLNSSRAWIQNKIETVNLDQIRKITDPKLRLTKLIQVQNWVFSHLSVDPTQVEPFFHLAGVTHLLTLDLLHSNQEYFENQESWILSAKPLLETLISYAHDFEHSEEEVKNMEALLEDVLLVQQKMTGSKK
jgi:hypothetical protein